MAAEAILCTDRPLLVGFSLLLLIGFGCSLPLRRCFSISFIRKRISTLRQMTADKRAWKAAYPRFERQISDSRSFPNRFQINKVVSR